MANAKGGPDEHLSADGKIRDCTAPSEDACRAGKDGEAAIPVPPDMTADQKEEWRKSTLIERHGNGLDGHKKESGHVTTLEEIMNTPTEADLLEAKEAVLVIFANKNFSEVGWNKLMPEKSRMTDKNNKEYYRKVEQIAAQRINLEMAVEQKAKIFAQMDAYGRAFESGVKIPKDIDDHFEKMWAGKANGLSEEGAISSLNSGKRSLEDLLAGKITPGSIVGSGYKNPKKVATEYLTKKIKEYTRAVETKGRSYSVNVANAEYVTRPNKDKLVGSA